SAIFPPARTTDPPSGARTEPPSAPRTEPPSARHAGADALELDPLEFTPSVRPPTPAPTQSWFPPPEELRAALTIQSPPPDESPSPSEAPSAALPAARPSSRSGPLKQKPDPSTRPLIGYSLSEDAVEPEHLETTRPPRR